MNILLLALCFATVATAARTADMSKPPAVGPIRSVQLPPRAEWELADGRGAAGFLRGPLLRPLRQGRGDVLPVVRGRSRAVLPGGRGRSAQGEYEGGARGQPRRE